jgi:hypothetical protein
VFSTGLSFDSTGNIYVRGNESLGPSFYKLDSSGTVLLTKVQGLGQAGSEYRAPITLDSSGNIYMGARSATGFNWVLAKFNSSGTEQWETKETGTVIGSHFINGLALSSAGDLLACGTYITNVSPNDGSLHVTSFSASSGSATNVFDFQPTGSYALGFAITTDSSGNVYVTGEDEGNTGNAFVIKLNSSYVSQWGTRFGPSSNYAYPFGVAVNSTGDVYTVGVTTTTGKVFLAKLSSTGSLTWCRTLSTFVGSPSYFNATGSVAVDTDGSIYFVATSYSGATYNNVIAKYSSSGAIQWQRNVLPSSGNTVALTGLVLTSTAISISGYDTASYKSVVLRIPKDGSKTGTVSPGGVTWSYSASSYTDAASGYTGASIAGSSVNTQSFAASTSSSSSSTATITATQI